MRPLTGLVAIAIALATGCSPSSTTATNNTPVVPKTQQSPPPPCHPGCFPAGTSVATPDGPRPIESLRAGDRVIRVAPDGSPIPDIIQSTFHTMNVLVILRTQAGELTTTPTQPLCREAGEFCRAGDLKPGDRIWTWRDGRRIATEVREVIATDREVAVFNLVVGDSAVFIANGFLAKGKPPLERSLADSAN